MPRKIPEDRFSELIRTATQVFIERGYRLTQMADIAEALGVAKGSLYTYVESKEALFMLCFEQAVAFRPVGRPPVLPVPTPAPGALGRRFRRQLRASGALPELGAALQRERAIDIRDELDTVIRELYALTQTYAVAITLVERAVGHPEISQDWQTRGREDSRQRLAAYIESRIQSGQLRALPEPRLAARFVIECIATWAMHIRWDPSPEHFDEKAAQDNLVEFLVRGLLARGRVHS